MTVPTSILTAQDVADFRRDFNWRLPDVTDEALTEAFAGHDNIVWLARRWGWHDTEVRDSACIALEDAGLGPDGGRFE